MALEHYSRGQKIAVTALIVLIAGMFTVTGSMTTLLGDGSKHPTHAGVMDGRTYGVIEFQHIRQGLRTARQLDYYQGQGEEKPRAIYARVPALTTMAQDASDTPFDRSLLDIWPSYQDNDIWCHLALVKRAEAAGFVRPSNQAVWKAVTSLINATASELERFKQENLYREFQDRFGFPLRDIEPALRDCLMVRDYVDSLLAAERTRLADIAAVVAGNDIEVKTQYVRLGVEPFLARARAEVEREHFNHRAARAAGAAGLSTRANGDDPFETTFEKHRFTQLSSDAEFEFDLFRAEFEDFLNAVPRDEKLERIYYAAMRKNGEFAATEADKKNIDARVEKAFNDEDLKRRKDPEFKGFTPEEEKKLREELKTKLMAERSFEEVSAEIYSTLRKEKAPLFAQAAVAAFKAELDEEREKREKTLRAESSLNQQKQRNIEALRSQRQDLRSRFDAIANLVNTYFTGAALRMPVLPNAGASDDQKKSFDIQLSNLIEDLARNLEDDIGREQLNSLVTTAQRSIQDLDRQLRDKEAGLEDKASQKELKGPDGEVMDDEQRRLELARIQLEIDGIKEQIALRDLLLDGKGGRKEDSVRRFADQFRKLLVGYKLTLRAAAKGNDALRKFAVEELLVEVPAELSRALREAKDRIVSQAGIDDLESALQLLRADNEAFDARIRREAANTLSLNIEAKADSYKLKYARFGSARLLKWGDVLADDRLAFLENVDGAKRFLEEPGSNEGAFSEIMGLADKGLYMLRLRRKVPKFQQGHHDARQRVFTLAAATRARELCVAEMKALRADIIKRGFDTAVADFRKKWPQAEVKDTPFITNGMDIPGVNSEGDSELLAFSSTPSLMDPDKPYVDRVKEIKPEEGISEIIPEKFNRDIQRRPDEDQWAYLLARVTDRRAMPRRLSEKDVEDSGFGSGPANILRERRLASSQTVLDLINPKVVLEKHTIERFPTPKEIEDAKEAEKAGK